MPETPEPSSDQSIDQALLQLFRSLEGPPEPNQRERLPKRRRVAYAAATATVIALVIAATAVGLLEATRSNQPGERSNTFAACALGLDLGGRWYYGAAAAGLLSRGDRLGNATQPTCGDLTIVRGTGDDSTRETNGGPPVEVDAYAIQGVRPAVAIIGSDGKVYVSSHRCILIETHACVNTNLHFEGRIYAPTRESRLTGLSDGEDVGTGILSVAGESDEEVNVRGIVGVPPTSAVRVSRDIFIADGVCTSSVDVTPSCLNSSP
jgi:hypothetical protein